MYRWPILNGKWPSFFFFKCKCPFGDVMTIWSYDSVLFFSLAVFFPLFFPSSMYFSPTRRVHVSSSGEESGEEWEREGESKWHREIKTVSNFGRMRALRARRMIVKLGWEQHRFSSESDNDLSEWARAQHRFCVQDKLEQDYFSMCTQVYFDNFTQIWRKQRVIWHCFLSKKNGSFDIFSPFFWSFIWQSPNINLVAQSLKIKTKKKEKQTYKPTA